MLSLRMTLRMMMTVSLLTVVWIIAKLIICTLGMDNEADEDVMIKDLTINDDGKMTCNEV